MQLNAEPDADEVRLLCGHNKTPVVPGLVLVDAWRYADPLAGHVMDARRTGDLPVEGVWPSDHAAVVVDLAS